MFYLIERSIFLSHKGLKNTTLLFTTFRSIAPSSGNIKIMYLCIFALDNLFDNDCICMYTKPGTFKEGLPDKT